MRRGDQCLGYDAACRDLHPRGDFTPRFTNPRATRAPSACAASARTHGPCPDLPALFHAGCTHGVGFGPCRGFPSAAATLPLGTAGLQRSPLHITGGELGDGPILSWAVGPSKAFPRGPAPRPRVPSRAPPARHRSTARAASAAAPAVTASSHGLPRLPSPASPRKKRRRRRGAVALQSVARPAAGRTPERTRQTFMGLSTSSLIRAPKDSACDARHCPEPGLWVDLGDRRTSPRSGRLFGSFSQR
jgi:hypothetical protein